MNHLSRLGLNILIVCLGLTVAACNFNVDNATPTADGVIEEPINPLPGATDTPDATDTNEPSPTQSLTPSVTASPPAIVQVITLPPSPTAFPTETPIPSPTLGPWEYVIQSGDTLGFIIQQAPHNYPLDFAVIDAVVALNENVPNRDTLPAVGQTILIPRPTIPPVVSEPIIAGSPIVATQSTRRVSEAVVGEPGCHTVQEGETVLSIVGQYGGLTLEIMSQLNGDTINFAGCDFEQPAGGPNCNILINTGQCILVPLPTPTITLSPTPDGNETPTPTPTFNAPSLVSPPDGAIVAAGPLTLSWVSVGILEDDEYYLVQVTDLTTDTTWPQVTRANAIQIDESMIPSDGMTHDMQWTVTIAVADDSGAYVPIGDVGQVRRFQWQSR